MAEEEYEVEAIRDYRIYRGKEEFFVKWKGYQEKDNSWENVSNLFCDALIKKYRKENKGKIENIKSQTKTFKEDNNKKVKNQSKQSKGESKKTKGQPKRIIKAMIKDDSIQYVFEQGTERYTTKSDDVDDVEQHLILSFLESNCRFTIDEDL